MRARAWLRALAATAATAALSGCLSARIDPVRGLDGFVPTAPAPTTAGVAAPIQLLFLAPEDVTTRITRGEPVTIVDLGSAAEYGAGHVEDAVSHPQAGLEASAARLPKDRLLVLYCRCADDQASVSSALMLHQRHGFTRLAVLKGGYAAWKAGGNPTTEGELAP